MNHAALLALLLALGGCADKPAPTIQTVPSAMCDFRVVNLNKRLCEEQKGRFVIMPPSGHPCGTCILP